MDILTYLYQLYVKWCGNLPDASFALVVRLFLLLTLPFVFGALAFKYGSRSTMAQAAVFLLGVMTALAFPLTPFLAMGPHLRAWAMAFSILVIGFLPAALPTYLVPYFSWQKKLRWGFYTIVFLILMHSCAGPF